MAIITADSENTKFYTNQQPETKMQQSTGLVSKQKIIPFTLPHAILSTLSECLNLHQLFCLFNRLDVYSSLKQHFFVINFLNTVCQFIICMLSAVKPLHMLFP